jgi:hypothetical protein
MNAGRACVLFQIDRKMEKNNKDTFIRVRLTKDELEVIKNKSSSLGLTISAYIRAVAVQKRGRPRLNEKKPVRITIKKIVRQKDKDNNKVI